MKGASAAIPVCGPRPHGDVTMEEIVGYPLDRAEEILRRGGVSVRSVTVIAAPETGGRKYRPKKFSRRTQFVVFQRAVDGGAVDLEVVECGEPGTMVNKQEEGTAKTQS